MWWSQYSERCREPLPIAQTLIDDEWAQALMVGVLRNGNESYYAFGSVDAAETVPPDENSVFEDRCRSPPLEIDFPSIDKTAAYESEEYTGFYRPEDGTQDPSFPVRADEGVLLATGPGEIELRLWPLVKDRFFVRHFNAELNFERDDSGRVTHLDLLFEGRRARLERSNEQQPEDSHE